MLAGISDIFQYLIPLPILVDILPQQNRILEQHRPHKPYITHFLPIALTERSLKAFSFLLGIIIRKCSQPIRL